MAIGSWAAMTGGPASCRVDRCSLDERMNGLLTPWRLRVYPRVLIIALLLPVVIAVLAGSGASTVTGRLGGDFPAFYGAGIVVNERGIDAVYDRQVLAEAQRDFLSVEQGDVELLPFFYPPFVAQLYAPMAKLPYRAAYTIQTVAMFAAIAFAIHLLRARLARVDRWPIAAFALAVGLYPLYRSITGGQNTALTVLLLAASYRAQADDRPVLAGATVAILLYRPQYALPLAGLLFLRDRRSALGFAGVAAVLWSWGALLAGGDWVVSWYRTAQAVGAELAPLTPWWKISFIGFAEQILGDGDPVAYAVGGLLALASVIALMWVWSSREVPLDLQVAAAACGILLIPEHVIWYEAGVLAVPLLILADRKGRSAAPAILGLGMLALTAALLPRASAVPLFVVVFATSAWVGHEITLSRVAGLAEAARTVEKHGAPEFGERLND